MWAEDKTPREGDLYKRLTVAGHCFELRYGYYEDSERSTVRRWCSIRI